MTEPTLKRTVNLPQLTLYGLGTILGAGIYVLIGRVAAVSGSLAPLSFMVASLVAGLTAMSYAELSSRFPESGGEIAFVRAAFPRRMLIAATGWAVICNGTISAAAMATGFTGYMNVFLPASPALWIALLVIFLGLLAAWGIREAVWAAVVITLVEIGGLLVVIGVGGNNILDFTRIIAASGPSLAVGPLAILSGAQLAFYAYIGFEDMVNIAEEVRRPRVTMPLAIMVALVLATILYALVSMAVVTSLSAQELSDSQAPFADLLLSQGLSPFAITAISLLAIMNGALVQIIMASRILFSMSRHGLVSAIFSRVNPRTRTPVAATALISFIILTAALWLPIETLARIASSIALAVFALVNAALLVLKRRVHPPDIGFRCSTWVPGAGMLSCLAMLAIGLRELLTG
jgi:amino acid transporter